MLLFRAKIFEVFGSCIFDVVFNGGFDRRGRLWTFLVVHVFVNPFLSLSVQWCQHLEVRLRPKMQNLHKRLALKNPQ